MNSRLIYFKITHKIAFFSFFIGLMILSSCKKENITEITEIEEQLEIGFKMTMDGKEIKTDVFASYCQMGGEDYLVITNKAEHLNLPLSTEALEENDFVFIQSNTAEGSLGYGGQVLGESITGFDGLSLLFSEAELVIEANNGEFVIGSSAGTLTGTSVSGETIKRTYTMEFVAEVAEENTYCETAPVVFTELEAEPETLFKMLVNGVEIETNAVAAYCQTENQEVFIITSNEGFFDYTAETANFQENDFIFITFHIDSGTTFTQGSIALGEDITGYPGLSMFFSEADVTIESNDGQYITGSSQGTLINYSFPLPTDTIVIDTILYSYEIDFVAEIIETNNDCQ